MTGDCGTCRHAVARSSREWHGHMSIPVMVTSCMLDECVYQERRHAVSSGSLMERTHADTPQNEKAIRGIR